uniref:Peptidase_M14 domain-containing protein n=1 Tax=Steinernema glaseri TaxID=37863 RepID=A0A1I7YF77_9BILA
MLPWEKMIDRDERRIMRLIAAALIVLLFIATTIGFFVWLSHQHEGYVIRVEPETERQHNFVAALYFEGFFNVRFINETTKNGTDAMDIVVRQDALEDLENFLIGRKTHYEIIKEIDEEINFPEKVDAFALGHHNSYDSIVKWMNELTLTYYGLVETFTMGTTHEHRPIVGIRIGVSKQDKPKRAIWIDGGTHGREWAAVHAVTFFIHQLLCQYGIDKNMTKYVDTLEFFIVPVVNPDGYEFTRSAIDNRLWRKNRSARQCNATGNCCQGVDLNRNFDVFFGERDSSDDPCSNMHQGTAPFSEPETRAIKDMVLSNDLKDRLHAFITMHTFGQTVLYPDTMGNDSLHVNEEELKSLGAKVVDAIKGVRGTEYKTGKSSELMYPFSGSHDWAAFVAGIKNAFCIEMSPLFTPETKTIGFMLPKDELVPTAIEVWEGVKAIIEAVIAYKEDKPK